MERMLPNDWCPCRKRTRHTEIHTRECHVTMEAETAVINLQDKDTKYCWNLGIGKERCFSSLWKEPGLLTP